MRFNSGFKELNDPDRPQCVNSIGNTEKLPEARKESITVPIYKKGDKETVVNIEAYHSFQLRSKFYPTSCCQV